MDQFQYLEVSCTINSNYWKTLPGILRTLMVISGLLAIALNGSGMRRSIFIENEHWRENICKLSGDSEYCPQVWLIELAFSIIVLAWIYTLIIFVVIILSKPEFRQRRKVCWMDTVGHLISGFLLTTSFILVLVYVIQIYRFQTCDDKILQRPRIFSINTDCAIDRKYKLRPANFIAGMAFALVFGILAFLIVIVDNRFCCNRHQTSGTINHQSVAFSQSHLLSNEDNESREEVI